MKLSPFSLVIVLLFTSLSAQTVTICLDESTKTPSYRPGGYCYIFDDFVNAYKAPSADAEVVKVLHIGERYSVQAVTGPVVMLFGQKHGWIKISNALYFSTAFYANVGIAYEDRVFMCSAPLTNMTEKYLELRYVRNGKFESYRFKSPEPPNEDYGLRLTLYENRSRLPEKEFYLTIHNGGVSDNTPDLVFLFRIYKEKIELLSTDEYNDTDEKNIMVTHLFPESINDKKIIIKSEHIPQEWGNAVKLQEKQISLVY